MKNSVPIRIFLAVYLLGVGAASNAVASDNAVAVAPPSVMALKPPAATTALPLGPLFTLTLTGVVSFIGVAAAPGSGVAGATAGDMFFRSPQKMLFSTNDGTSAALNIDAAGNITAAASVTAPSFVGNASSATSLTGSFAGDVTGTQSATLVAFVGGQTAANIASATQAANAATSANTINTIVKRDSTGKINVGAIAFADGSVLTSASLRKYYLANANAAGDVASSQCAAGFHMASLFELLNPSALTYDTTRGIVYADSGSGPPQEVGWVRTGNASRNTNVAGTGNCNAWSSADVADYGTSVFLPFIWAVNPQTNVNGTQVGPWFAAARTCNTPLPVWCIQD